MIRKFRVSFFLALLFGLSWTRPALAQDTPPDSRSPQRGFGQIIELGDTWFVMENRAGTHTIFVDATTQYKFPDGTAASFSELQLSMWVAGSAAVTDSGQVVASLVILTPDDFDPNTMRGRVARGVVIALSESEMSFTLKTVDDLTVRIQTTPETIFQGGLASFQDIKLGIRLAVRFQPPPGDSVPGEILKAVVVASPSEQRPAGQRFSGRVAAIDLQANTLTLEKRNGDLPTFILDEDTQFYSGNGGIIGLADVEVGMGALIGALLLEDGRLLAKGVAVGEGALLDAERMAGEVTAVGNTNFTISIQSGESVTFAITADTRFFSRNSNFDGLEDLQLGMQVAVVFEEAADASDLTAMAILASLPTEEGITE